MKYSKKDREERPWLKFYEEEGIPANIEYPDCSMVDMIIQSAEKWPDNTAYVYYGHKVTYKNFVKKIEKAARALKNYGVKEGDRVTICMPNTPEGITMVYAVNMVGAVCNMVHPLSSEKELEYYIKIAAFWQLPRIGLDARPRCHLVSSLTGPIKPDGSFSTVVR